MLFGTTVALIMPDVRSLSTAYVALIVAETNVSFIRWRQLALEAQSKAALLCGSTLVMRISTLSHTLDELETRLDRFVKSA